MKTFELLFSKSETSTPIAQLFLTSGRKETTPRIIEECTSLSMLNDLIERLHEELDEIKTEGRRKFMKTSKLGSD